MHANIDGDPKAGLQRASPVETDLAIQGMTCGNCARHVAEALQRLPGIQSVHVDLSAGQASIHWRPGVQEDEGAVFRAVREAGYEPRRMASPRTDLRISGMTCSGCARNVSDALQNVPGVERVDVHLDEGTASVTWKAGRRPDALALVESVRKAGYDAKLIESLNGGTKTNPWSPVTGWQFNVVVGTVLTLPLFVLEWILGAGLESWYRWLAFGLVLPIQLLCGARFYRGAWNQAKVGSSNMDTLVVLGSTTAFVYSTWALFSNWPGHLFFMESASIITFISIGHWVESKMSLRAAETLRSLLDLAPRTARLLDPGGAEIEVPVSSLKVGDHIVVKPGDRVPIDSEVIEGASVVDESMLTGESVPVSKAKGAKIFGGTTNAHGWLLGRVAATGEATALAQVIAVVQRAQTSRANIQRLGDRVSNVFVPIVIAIALGTGLWWGLAPIAARSFAAWLQPFLWHAHGPDGVLAAAIYHAAAVLIVACPCAMGLATPVAIMAGTNVAAERGILIRDGVALEKSGAISAVVFDKTGTLTQGRLALAEVEDFLNPAEQTVGFHKIVASLAKQSQHPLSQAVASLSNVVVNSTDWSEIRGSGVQGRLLLDGSPLAGVLLRLGSTTWLRENGVVMEPGVEFIKQWSNRGATILGVAAEQRLLGLIALRDAIKPNAAQVIGHLKRREKKIYLVTGDNQQTSRAIAELAGIPAENVFAEVRPEQKAGIVETLQKRGEAVAFVGDGINDAPALEQADLGIAVSRASDVAREAADILLLKSDIQAVPEALALADATLRTIKQNLFWAFFYNACGVPLAALGFLSPIFSAFAMGASDVVVIGNALRLRRWKFRQ